MLNLIRKDFVLQKKTLFILLPILFFFVYTDAINITVDDVALGTSNIWIGILFGILIIMDNFSKDEKKETKLLLNALPYTRKEIVTSKYISACLFVLLTLVTIVIANLVFHEEAIPWEHLLIISCAVIAFVSFAFPFSYFFKSQYLFYAIWILLVLLIMVIVLFLPDFSDSVFKFIQFIVSLEKYQLYSSLATSVLLIYIISWRTSILLYRL